MIYGGKAVLSGGEIRNNRSSNFGGGIFTQKGADIIIKSGFAITGNISSVGGGMCNNGRNAIVEGGAVIANNTAADAGDDIAHYGDSLALSSAQSMNMFLSTDNSNNPITGWYSDYPRWQADGAQEIDVTDPLGKVTTFLKAAYENTYIVTYRFVSDSEGEGLPDEVVDLLPIDIQEYHLGDNVAAIQPEQLKVRVTDGVWEFKGYDEENKTIESATTEFVGSWTFKPDIILLNEAPVIHANDKIINIGDDFNPLEGVTATDKEDGTITLTIDNVIKNDVDTTKAGVYSVTYKVTDSKGAFAIKTIKVTVKDKDTSVVPDKPDDINKPIIVPYTSVNDKIPQTGDHSNISLFISMLAGSMGVLAVLFGRKRKRSTND